MNEPKQVGVHEFFTKPAKVFALVERAKVVFVMRHWRHHGAIISPVLTKVLESYYKSINADWPESIEYPISEFVRGFATYYHDVVGNHIIRLTYRGKWVGAWISNRTVWDLVKADAPVDSSGWPGPLHLIDP